MLTVVVLALALATDAFAAAVSQGASAAPRPRLSLALIVGLAFGLAQAVMPLAGWALGVAFQQWIRDFDHWVAFVLLVAIGINMLRAAARDDAPVAQRPGPARINGWTLATTALATSIDAAAAGVTLPLLGPPVLVSCATIGAITFVLSSAGVFVGGAAGAVIGRRAEALGGVVLIAIGTKILVEHVFLGG